MKDLGKVVLIGWAVLATLLSSWLFVELGETRAQLHEEIVIKYEYSAMIDSLLSEQHYLNTLPQ